MKKTIPAAAIAMFGLLPVTMAWATTPIATVSQTVQPSATGSGINGVLGETYEHYVVEPQASANRKNILVVFLGGSSSTPGDYNEISDEAAQMGYGVLDLRYPDSEVVGTVCALSDDCFRNIRGETLFGQNQAYAAGQPDYNSTLISVNTANSVINRLVCLLDYLSHQSASASNPDPGYWAQFLAANSNSPYVTPNTGKAYPDWSKIVIAGHSQGGGNAAFLATHLPAGTAVRRVVMFSAPNDHGSCGSASWILENASTPLNRFWGLRNDNEGTFGSAISANWANLGSGSTAGAAYSYGGVGGTLQSTDVDVGAGAGAAGGMHRLMLTVPDAALSTTNHNSTATDDPLNHFPTDRHTAWDYLFTADFTD